MATPLTWLALDGIRKSDGTAAAGGALFAYLPGTKTQATLYADVDETAILSQPVTLDGAGRATACVTSIVKLVVLDSDGATIASIDRATALHEGTVEIENPAFTGSTGVAGDKTNLHTVLARADDSFGGTDWNYKESTGATSRAVHIAISERGLSVKDRGAIGNGVAIDTTAFNSAIAAIQSAGGGKLIVPSGTYLVDAALTTIGFTGLTIEGAGSQGSTPSTIRSTSLTANIFTVAANCGLVLRDVKLTASSASTGYAVQAGGTQCVLERIAVTNFEKGVYVSGSGTTLYLCDITNPTNTAFSVLAVTGSSFVRIIGGTLGGGSGIAVQFEGSASDITISGVRFASSTATAIKAKTDVSGTGVRVTGCDFSGATAAINMQPTSPYALGFTESGNTFASATITDTSWGSVYGSFNGGRKGTDITAATTISPTGGRFFIVSGNTNIDHIRTAGFNPGDILTFKFTGTPTVNDNTGAPPAGYAAVQTAGAFAATADDIFAVIYDGTDWKEFGRNVL